MKENPDMGTQSGEERIDELLNGYIDDELAIRQRTEVERLVAHDPRIERRLQELRKCRTLLGSMPCAEAPPQILLALKASLATTAPLYEESTYNRRAGRMHLLARKMLSAAAMLALVALLGGVIYTILAPETIPVAKDPPPSEDVRTVTPAPIPSPVLAFSGRLELTTGLLDEIDSIVSAAIRENGLSASVGDVRKPHQRIHYLDCSRDGLNALLASLEYAWPKLNSATMVIDTGVFNDQVSVDAVTTDQIAKIIDQGSHETRIELAKEFDMLNSVAEDMPDRTLRAVVDAASPSLPIMPRPVMTSGAGQTPIVPEADKTIRLTIILSR